VYKLLNSYLKFIVTLQHQMKRVVSVLAETRPTSFLITTIFALKTRPV